MAESNLLPALKDQVKNLKTEVKEVSSKGSKQKAEMKDLKTEVKDVVSKGSQQKAEIKNLKSEVKEVSSKGEKQSADLNKLKLDIEGLKKKGVQKKQLSEYNLFVRRQLKQGRTFAQAVRLWKRQQKATKNLKKTSRQAKLSKPVKAAKPKSKSIVKTVLKKPAAKKSAPKKSLVKKAQAKKPVAKKVPVKKPAAKKIVKQVRPKRPSKQKSSAVFSEVMDVLKENQADVTQAKEQVSHVLTKLKDHEKILLTGFGQTSMAGAMSDETPSDEEMAVKLTSLYFKEIARLGFKRSLELDSVINAYFYSLARLKRKETEARQIIDALKNAVQNTEATQ